MATSGDQLWDAENHMLKQPLARARRPEGEGNGYIHSISHSSSGWSRRSSHKQYAKAQSQHSQERIKRSWNPSAGKQGIG
jgi:hypothetical protein